MPSQRLLVVADAHVGSGNPDSDAALLAFLDAAPGLGDSLLVVGDLFEFWFAYRAVIPRRAFPVAAALATLARRMPVSMVGGNHDRWGRPFWGEDTGVRYSRGEINGRVGASAFVAVHGDGLAERPGRARLTHRVVSSRAVSAAFSAIHPDLGYWLVTRLSPLLGKSNPPPEVTAASAARQRRYAAARLQADPAFQFLVMGHTHVPVAEELEPGRHYVNPGAWLDGGRYALLHHGNVELRRF